MDQRASIVAALVMLTVPSLAGADAAPSPPPPLAIEAVPRVHTARVGGPSEATFGFRNFGTTPLRVRVESLVAILPGMRLPLRLEGASPGREFTVPAQGRVELQVRFAGIDGPAARRRLWTIQLRASVEGAGEPSGRYAVGSTIVRRVPLPG